MVSSAINMPQRKKEYTIPLLVSLLIIGGAILLSNLRPSSPRALDSFDAHAEAIIKKCASASHRVTCYDEEIPKLIGELSMEETFEVTRRVQEQDRNYWYCHVLGHELSAQETAKNPSQWKEVVARCPSGMCSNGCLHGAFQERFRADAMPDADLSTLTDTLAGICAARPGWNPTSMERATCYHALGHLAMYVTAADVKKSIVLCEAITEREAAGNFLQLCYDGTFMQIFQPLEPEDFALVKGKQPTKETVKDFCWKFEDKQRNSCWSESWPLFFAEVTTPRGLVTFCGTLEDLNEENRCYSALFYVLTAQFNFNLADINRLCRGLPQERRGQCFANAASRLIETDARLVGKSLELCQLASAFRVEGDCYRELVFYSTYNFHRGSPEFLKLCESLPDPWREQCLSKN